MSVDPYLKGRLINFEPPGNVCQMAINQSMLILLTREGSILRADLSDNSEPSEIKIWKDFDDWIVSLHLQRKFCFFYASNHNLLCLTPVTKIREIALPKGTKLTAMSWVLASYQMSPEKVLLMSSNGKILELEVATEDESTLGSLKGKINQIAVMENIGNSFLILPIVRQTGKSSLSVLVIFATNYSVYFCSGSFTNNQEDKIFDLLFDRNNILDVRLDQDSVDFDNIWATYTENDSLCPSSMVLVSLGKILYFQITPLKLFFNSALDYVGRKIKSISLLQHNVVILTAMTIDIISIYNGHVVYSQELDDEMSPYIGISNMVHSNSLWLASERNVFRFRYLNENRKVLDILVEQQQFEKALYYAHENSDDYEMVLDLYAEYLFKSNKETLVKNVNKFSHFSRNFEAMALRFVECGDQFALKTFLIGCYFSMDSEDTVKVCALIPWIVEVFLNLLAQCQYEFQEKLDLVMQELQEFLKNCDLKNLEKIKEVLFELIHSHDEMSVLLFLSSHLKDYEELMNLYIRQRDYFNAVQLIDKPELDHCLLAKVAPMLVQNVPELFVDAVVLYLNLQTDPEVVRQLIPELVRAFVSANAIGSQILGIHALRFLKTAIEQFDCRDGSVHDFYVALLLEHDPSSLMDYLITQNTGENEKLPYDVRKALSLCTHSRHFEAACYLYDIQGLHQNAVLMALEAKRLDKAMEIARMSGTDNKKKLFTKIIEWIIKSPGTVDIVPVLMKLINDGEMELDQVLPLIPDDCLVDTFKDAIVNCLRSYDNKISSLHQEIGDIDKMAEKLKNCCNDSLKKQIVINPEDKCNLCSFSVVESPFYVFPCTHVFHQNCLTKEHNRLISQINESGVDMSWYDHSTSVDDPECVFCSDLFIHMILVPFNSEEPY